MRGFFAVGLSLLGFAAQADTMKIESGCFAGYTESCFIVVEGRFDRDASRRFREFVHGDQAIGFKVLFDVSGGDLKSGLEIGRIIRERGLSTEIGKIVRSRGDIVEYDGVTAGADCLSACAYAFLGGEVRVVPGGNRLGFHRFAPQGGGDLPGAGGLASGQEVSGLLISYLLEMNIDPRVFVHASGTPSSSMYFPSRSELLSYDLATPSGFNPFDLHPHQGGVFAVTARQDATRPYDHVFAIQAYCVYGDSIFRLASDYPSLPSDDDGSAATIRFGTREIAAERVSIEGGKNSSISIWFPKPSDAVIDQANSLEVGYQTSRALGGYHVAKMNLTRDDREILKAAFKLCI